MTARILLFGCGRIGALHAKILGQKQLNDCELAGVIDVDRDRAASLADQYGVSWATTVPEFVSKGGDFDAITIATESGNHASHVAELAVFGRALLVEKPLGLTVKQVDRILRISADNDVPIFEVKQNRLNEAVVRAQEIVSSGLLGRPLIANVTVRWCRPQEYYDQDAWRGTLSLDGGVLSNQAIHHLDLLLLLMGPAKSVFAYTDKLVADIEAEDSAVVVLKFENGALGTIEATTAARPKNLEGSVTILAEHGIIEIGGHAANKLSVQSLGDSESILSSLEPEDVYGAGHLELYKRFSAFVLNRASPTMSGLVDGLEARQAVALIEAINRSARLGQEVSLV